MARYICFYFTTEAGKAPVEEFIDSLDYSTQRKFFFKKGLLEEFGQRLPYPHAKYIGDDIYELRFERKIPEKVAIDEAVRLAKELSGEKSYAFINAVLGKILNELKSNPQGSS